MYEAITDLPLLRNSLLPFGQTDASPAQLGQMQKAAALADGHRSSNFIAANHVGNAWAEHLDRDGQCICSEVLVGRMTWTLSHGGRKYITTFKHDFDSTRCPIDYSFQVRGTSQLDVSVERLALGREWNTETSTPKLTGPDPQKRYCNLRICQGFMTCAEMREADRIAQAEAAELGGGD